MSGWLSTRRVICYTQCCAYSVPMGSCTGSPTAQPESQSRKLRELVMALQVDSHRQGALPSTAIEGNPGMDGDSRVPTKGLRDSLCTGLCITRSQADVRAAEGPEPRVGYPAILDTIGSGCHRRGLERVACSALVHPRYENGPAGALQREPHTKGEGAGHECDQCSVITLGGRQLPSLQLSISN